MTKTDVPSQKRRGSLQTSILTLRIQGRVLGSYRLLRRLLECCFIRYMLLPDIEEMCFRVFILLLSPSPVLKQSFGVL